MKKVTLLSLAFICIVSIANAQINKGSVLLGGGINFNHNKDENNNVKSNWIGLTPAFGKAIRQNTVAGIQLLYSHLKNNLTSFPENEINSYGVGVFIRKYKPLGNGFYLFGEAGLLYTSSSYTYFYPTYKNKQEYKSIGINLYPGISYAVSKKFHLEASLANLLTFRYSKNKITSAGIITQDKNDVDLNVNASSLSNINVGFRFFLSK
jgi:Outer membrane protein beta-barrel domain